MRKLETIQDFYRHGFPQDKQQFDSEPIGQFNIFPRSQCEKILCLDRKDFYKLSFITKGSGIVHYPNRDVQVHVPAIFLSNPKVEYEWRSDCDEEGGWFCLFTEEFLHSAKYPFISQSYLLFQTDENILLNLDKKTCQDVQFVFAQMLISVRSDYIHKYRTYLQLLIHLIAEQQPNISIVNHFVDAAQNITYQFLKLLELQFPIEDKKLPLKLKSVGNFAKQLFVHENHLNAVVTKVTGKNPSQHIALRVLHEAQ